MFAQILGETTCGIDGVQILVEVDVSNGLPSFSGGTAGDGRA